MSVKKVLTICVAAYNVEDSLENTLDSLIVDDCEKIEVIIVNDGSKDKTLEIAEQYKKKYPNIFKVINKENGGYGSTINYGVKEATGKYFKQLDGGDRYDTKNLEEFCKYLETTDADAVCTPYIEKNVKLQKTEKKMPEFFRDNNLVSMYLDKISKDDYEILKMHTLAYRTQLLKNNNINIREKCFYTDVEYVFLPCLFVKTVLILDLPIYIYNIGEDGQSVSLIGKRKHHREHTEVMNDVLDNYVNHDGANFPPVLVSYIAEIVLHEIISFRLDIGSIGLKSYENVKSIIMKIKRNYRIIYDYMKTMSRGVVFIERFGYFGFVGVKIIRKIKQR